MSPRATSALHWALLAVVVGALVWAGAWRLGGGRWERVETASMGAAAPVNSLLWVESVAPSSLRRGDFITFHPPGRPDVTYSHRIAAIARDGTLTTKGDITAPDPWRVTPGDVVGRVVMTWKGVGWIVVAAPVLLGGGALLCLVLWRIRERTWRTPAAVVGVALLVSVAIVVYRPLVRAEQLGFGPAPGGARATYVSTGLLPVRLQAHGGSFVDLYDGQVGSVPVTQRDEGGRYGVTVRPHVPLWWWALLLLLCFVPALWTLLVGLPPAPSSKRRGASHLGSRRAFHPFDRSVRPTG